MLTDDAELSELNAAHMGVDGPTDVLSFPMFPPESFARPGGEPASATASRRAQGDSGASRTGGTGRLGSGRPGSRRTHIGDIAISVERAIGQAEQGRGGQTGDVRWSPADELLLLVTHGTLHLCGWDHADPAQEAKMQALERRLLG